MDKLNILVVGGHPADVFDRCGGTMAHHIRRGDAVTALALTTGIRVHDVVVAEQLRLHKQEIDKQQLTNLLQERQKGKYAEVIKACDILGITDVRFLSYDDKMLLVTGKLVEDVARVIRSVRPHIIITHYPFENGGIAAHHGTTGKIVMHAAQYAGAVDIDDPNPGYRAAQIFFMMCEEASFVRSPLAAKSVPFYDYYVDISDVVELKVKALDTMRSQQYGGNSARRQVEAIDGKDGHCMGVPYAEAFLRYYPEIGDCLPVSNELLERANEPEANHIKRSAVFIAPFVDLPPGES